MVDSYARHPALKTALPPLVRKQRRLETQIAPIEPLLEQEKAVRKEIDALLLKAGLAKGDTVTCLGYDVTHRERRGAESINETTLVNELEKLGLSVDAALSAIKASLDKADDPQWAEVKPSKGAKVRR